MNPRSSSFAAEMEGADAALRARALFDWRLWSRPNQLEPVGAHRFHLILAGRGFGKTWASVQFVTEEIRAGRARRVGAIARTSADASDTITEGQAGFFTLASRTSKNNEGLPATIEAVEIREKYQDLINTYPSLGGLILGIEGGGAAKFNAAVYERQFQLRGLGT